MKDNTQVTTPFDPTEYSEASLLTQTEGEQLKNRLAQHNIIIIGVVIVLFIGFTGILITAGAMINDSLAEKKAISQSMRDEIKAQNNKIDALTEAVQEYRKNTPPPIR